MSLGENSTSDSGGYQGGLPSEPRTPADNHALAALHDFAGPIELIAAGRDESIPLQTIRNFVAAADANRIDYHLLQEATHTLYEIPAMGKLSFRLLRNWLLDLRPQP